jgi:hypothetical protein
MFSLKVTGEPAGENPSRAGFRPPVSIAITTSPAAQAFGSVHFESVDGARPSLTGAELRAEGARKRQIRTTRLEWKADGSFQLRGLYGRLLLRWSNLPSGWTVKEMRLAGRDVSSETLDFVPGTPPVGPLDVVFVRR